MSTTRDAYLRGLDSRRRHFTAVKWEGPISELDADELQRRADSLARFLVPLVSMWGMSSDPDAVEVTEEEVFAWVEARKECLRALERVG